MVGEENGETEEQEQDESEVFTIDGIESTVSSLDPNIIDNIKLRGLYRISYKGKPDDEEGDESEENEERQVVQMVKRISSDDIFDRENGELIDADDNGSVHDVVFYDGNDTIYFGDVTVVHYKDSAGNDRSKIVPHGKGRFYKKNECECAGFFKNGKKTAVVSFKKNGEKFLHDYKGDKTPLVHHENDLLILMENEKADKKKAIDVDYENVIKYSLDKNRLINENDYERDLINVNNVKILIDNGYEFNFDRQNNDFVDEKGETTIFPAIDREKMYIDVDKIVENIISIVNRCGGTLKVIEIVGMNNFGYLKDREGNDLIDVINVRLRPILYSRGIKLFVQNVGEQSFVDRVTDQFVDGKKRNTVVANGMNYSVIDTESGQRAYFNNKEEYEAELKETGYYNNIFSINDDQGTEEEGEETEEKKEKKNKSLDDIGIVLWDVDVDVDSVRNIRKNELQELKKKNKTLKEKHQALKKGKVYLLNNNSSPNENLSSGEQLLCIVAGIVLFIFGYIMLRKYFINYKKYNSENNNPDEQIQSNDSKGTEASEQTQQNDDGKSIDASKQAQSDNYEKATKQIQNGNNLISSGKIATEKGNQLGG